MVKMMENRYDLVVIGGGILGLATALELSRRFPRYSTLVVEKEKGLAGHQTGHNSGVIHSGIYYKPGSLKARNCVAGARALREFCDEHGINYQLCGKVVVASDPSEVPALEELHRRGAANGVPGLEMIGPERLKELEPHARGVKALYSPETGIIDYVQVTEAYARAYREKGGEVLTGVRVTGIERSGGRINLITTRGDISATYLINCAGLYADAIAGMMGVGKDLMIIPFRGEYYNLTPEARYLVMGLIYPVPDPDFPFLGVHFTRDIRGGVEAGPNAVLAFAREGYRMVDFDLSEFVETLGFPGFWFMAARYWRTGIQEFHRSLSKKAFVRALQKLLPDIKEQHLQERGAGVRAQAVERNGLLVDDFRISETKNAIHVRNAPSPGATASLAIGRDIVAMAERSFPLKP
jgi:L-2-hydroxyglutarate oxidase LhgO